MLPSTLKTRKYIPVWKKKKWLVKERIEVCLIRLKPGKKTINFKAFALEFYNLDKISKLIKTWVCENLGVISFMIFEEEFKHRKAYRTLKVTLFILSLFILLNPFSK